MNISKTKDNLKNNGQLNLIEYVYTKKSCLIIQGKTNEFSSIYLYCILVDEFNNAYFLIDFVEPAKMNCDAFMLPSRISLMI